jgi:hypothetical protein
MSDTLQLARLLGAGSVMYTVHTPVKTLGGYFLRDQAIRLLLRVVYLATSTIAQRVSKAPAHQRTATVPLA